MLYQFIPLILLSPFTYHVHNLFNIQYVKHICFCMWKRYYFNVKSYITFDDVEHWKMFYAKINKNNLELYYHIFVFTKYNKMFNNIFVIWCINTGKPAMLYHKLSLDNSEIQQGETTCYWNVPQVWLQKAANFNKQNCAIESEFEHQLDTHWIVKVVPPALDLR